MPEPGDLDDKDRALLAKVEAGFDTIGELYNAVHLPAVLVDVPALAWYHFPIDRRGSHDVY